MSVDNFFAAYGVDADEVSEDPFTVPDNTYRVIVSEAEITDFGKDNGVEFFSIQISVNDGGEHDGKNANLLFRMPPLTAADQENYKTANARTLSNYKKALINFGLSEEGIKMFNPRVHASKLVGIKGTARMFPSKKEGYNNVADFKRDGVSVTPAESAPASVAAQEPDSGAVADLLAGF